MSPSEQRAREVFVELADTLVTDFDLSDFLVTLARHSVELIEVSAAGLVLAEPADTLSLAAASTDQARELCAAQLRDRQGPAFDCYHSGRPVHCADLVAADGRWPQFRREALAAGFRAAHAVPMRLRDSTIGALTLYSSVGGPVTAENVQLAQALADVATIGILHERTVRRHELLISQLQKALDTRILIEQAKGVLAERLGIPMDDSFTILRAHSRERNRRLRETAIAVINGERISSAPHWPAR